MHTQRVNSNRGSGKQVGNSWFTHMLGFVVCLGLPALVTAIAPIAVTKLTRENGQVTAFTQKNLFFVIPYQRQTLVDIRKADDRIHTGELLKRSAGDSGPRHRAEDEGFLVLSNTQESIEVPVSPVNLRNALQKVEAFLRDINQQELRFTTVANWKFSVIAAVPVVLLGVLYVVGVILAFLRWIGRLQSPRSGITTPKLP